MITPILEKYLLKGFASNQIHHIAYGSFAQLQIPDNSFVVIHKVYWNGWINQKFSEIDGQSWKDFFRYNEYTMKVQSDKQNSIYYQMRNEVNFQYFGAGGAFNLNDNISQSDYDKFILMTPKKPIIFDTWISSYKYLNFTITRNALMPDTGNFGIVNNYADENNIPFGVNDNPVLLDINLLGTNGTATNYNPPGVKPSHPPIVATPPITNTNNYHQDYDPRVSPDNGSFIDYAFDGAKLSKSEYVTNPLISLEYCVISKHDEGLLSSL